MGNLLSQSQFLQQISTSLGNYPQALGYESITVDNTVKKFTIPSNANRALVVVASSVAAPAFSIRYREDGGAPTASAGGGMPKGNTDAFEITGAENLARFAVIQETAGTHYLNITYYSR